MLALTRAELRGTADVFREVSELFSPGEDENAAFTHRQLRGVSGVIERLAEEAPEGKRNRFDVRVGVAGCPKAGNAETGDSMALRRIGGELLLLLSDGMGTGVCARRESSAVLAALDAAAARARSAGFAVAIGHPYPETLSALRRWQDKAATPVVPLRRLVWHLAQRQAARDARGR